MKIKIKDVAHAIDLLGIEFSRSTQSQTVRVDRAIGYYATIYQSNHEQDYIIIHLLMPNKIINVNLGINKTNFSDDLVIVSEINNEFRNTLRMYLMDNDILLTFLRELNGMD